MRNILCWVFFVLVDFNIPSHSFSDVQTESSSVWSFLLHYKLFIVWNYYFFLLFACFMYDIFSFLHIWNKISN